MWPETYSCSDVLYNIRSYLCLYFFYSVKQITHSIADINQFIHLVEFEIAENKSITHKIKNNPRDIESINYHIQLLPILSYHLTFEPQLETIP